MISVLKIYLHSAAWLIGAGMLGAKVLLSTATMPPALAYALFEAYQDGRKHYTEVNGELGKTYTVCCAWFDEYNKPIKSKLNNLNSFKETHTEFVNRRLSILSKRSGFQKSKATFVIKQYRNFSSESNGRCYSQITT